MVLGHSSTHVADFCVTVIDFDKHHFYFPFTSKWFSNAYSIKLPLLVGYFTGRLVANQLRSSLHQDEHGSVERGVDFPVPWVPQMMPGISIPSRRSSTNYQTHPLSHTSFLDKA